MPKINVYLPDGLAAAVRDANVPVSAICQSALERAVREVTALREAEPGTHPDNQEWAAGTGIAFARYTNRARHAVSLGRQAASSLGHGHVGTEHLLLGILEEGSNIAVRVLELLDVLPDDVERELRGHMTAGEAPVTDTPLTPSARTGLELATNESAQLGHNYMGCEHLLLGLIAEPQGLAGSVLRQLGLELHITRRAVLTALLDHVSTPQKKRVASRTRLEEILERLDAIEARLPS